MRLGRWFLLAIGVTATACASTIGPVIPSVQVLVVLDSADDTLRIIPVDSPGVVHRVLLSVAAFNKHALAVSGQFAAIGAGTSAFSTDLTSGHLVCQTQDLHGPIASLAFSDGQHVVAAVPSVDSTPQFDATLTLQPCAAGTGFVPGGPRAFVFARSNVFVVTGSIPPCASDSIACPSWLVTFKDTSHLPDSIALSPPGNAQGAVLASDGFLYVLNAGSGQSANARLSQVSPVDNTEKSVISGFGTLPQYIATDGTRIFVASAAQGLMVYNTSTRLVEHDNNSAIPLFGAPRGLAVDDIGRVYALIAGPCTAAGQGSVAIFGPDLVSKQPVTVGHCPVAIGVTDIPSTLYNFAH